MILSIGMIVKNEEKFLRSCLEALQPVLQQVQSELIIADTGSEDGTVAIAREFTDNVFHVDWCDDFSAARNAAMKKAKGEWFFFIDADEILEDPKTIIDFFNTGEYKAFNAAALTIRSGNDLSLTQWADNLAVRFIKLRDDSFFVNTVHEHFSRIYNPVKTLDALANHYGYVTEKNEEMIAMKMKRNLHLALAELEKNPLNHMMYLHASNACNMAGDMVQALSYCEKGYESAKTQQDPLQYLLFANMISLHARMKNHKQVIKLADAYFLSKSKTLPTDLEAAFLRAESCFLLEKYDEAIRSFLDYFTFFNDERPKDENAFEHTLVCADESSYLFGTLRLAHVYLEMGDLAAAQIRLNSRSFADYMSAHAAYWLDIEFRLLTEKQDYSALAEIYPQLDVASRTLFIRHIENRLLIPDNRQKIYQVFDTPKESADDYEKLMRLRSRSVTGALAAADVQSFFEACEALSPLFADAAYFAVTTGVSLQAVAAKIDALDLDAFFRGNPYYHFGSLALAALEAFGENAPADLSAALWLACLYQTELSGAPNAALFRAFANAANRVLPALFSPDVLTDDSCALLPRGFRAAYLCCKAEQARLSNRHSTYIRYLRTAVQADPSLKNLVQYLADELQRSLDSADTKKTEFDAHAAKVKVMIRQLVDGGQFSEAAELIRAYEALCPADPELAPLKAQINQ